MKKIIVLTLTIGLLFSGCTYHHEIVRLPEAPLYNQTVMFNNVQYLPLLKFCDYYDLDWNWDLVAQRIEVKRGDNLLVLRPDSDIALLNNKPLRLDYPIEYKNGAAYIPAKTAAFLTKDIFGLKEKPIPVKKWHEIRTIVIDPGHGGKDPGAISRYGTREKDIVLDVSKRLKKYLERSGLRVYLTRERDVFIPLNKRPAFANNKSADLFISVHANAFRRSRVRGFEVFHLSEATDDNARAAAAAENASLKFEEGTTTQKSGGSISRDPTLWDMTLTENRRQSKELAYYICNIAADKLSLKNRGVKGARFAVLKGAQMPAVLVEVGFLTNRREESKLKSSSFRERIASAISRSILGYKREYDRTNGFSQ